MAHDELVAEVQQLRQERDGYRNAYNIKSEEAGHLRSVAAPVLRESVAPELEGKPGIFVATLPKSGTVFIGHSLRLSLGYDHSNVLVTPTFPKNIIWEAMLDDFMRGGMISSSHLQPDETNIEILKRFGVEKILVHIRDPRAALSSWYHFRKDYNAGGGGLANVSRVVAKRPQPLFKGPKADVMNRLIPTWYAESVAWIGGWLERADDIPFLLKTHEELKASGEKYIASTLEAFDLSAPVKLVERNAQSHFRKGDNVSWQEDFTKDQRKQLDAALPDEWIERFGWLPKGG